MVIESIPHQVTLIHSFFTGAAREPLGRLAEEKLAEATGFRGLAIHESLDGERIVAYAQWEDEVSYRGALQRFAHDADAHEQFHALLQLPNEPHLYGIVETVPPEIDPFIEGGGTGTAVIELVKVRPGGQTAALRSLKSIADFFVARSCGFIAAAHHCGLDGTHLASYMQWESPEDYAAGWALARRFGLLECEDILSRDGRAYRVERVVASRSVERAADSALAEYANVPSHI